MSNVTSQSELTTKEIVEQAISDYHESILPYLNGQVPTIANKFDKANLYSTDEKIVGRWIDGKPLYQKVIEYPVVNCSSGRTVITDVSFLNIETLVFTLFNSCSAEGNSLGNFYPFSTDIRDGNLTVYVLSQNERTNRVTLQYTKTTDEAIAIGSDTDYSTTEKIVGTDTDGTPVWQCTYKFTNGISVTANQWVVIDIDSTSMNQIVLASARKGSAGLYMPIEANPTENSHTKVGILAYRTDSGITEITLQYTKTN